MNHICFFLKTVANLKHSIQHENKNCFSWLNGAEEKDTYFDPMDIIPLFLQQKKKVLKLKFGHM